MPPVPQVVLSTASSSLNEAALCCPVQYRRQYLEVIPQEILDRIKHVEEENQDFAARYLEIEDDRGRRAWSNPLFGTGNQATG